MPRPVLASGCKAHSPDRIPQSRRAARSDGWIHLLTPVALTSSWRLKGLCAHALIETRRARLKLHQPRCIAGFRPLSVSATMAALSSFS
jgi:hypothetical protein